MANMQVILLEGLHGIGRVGEVVKVKAGFARNYLLPRKLALLANKDNVAEVEKQKAELEAKNNAAKTEATKQAAKFEGLTLVLSRHASETGQLYGSLKARDFAEELSRKNLKVEASQVLLTDSVKAVGDHSIRVALHPEVVVTVPVTVERQTDM
ncbi:MAG: 50S ribosomal protein L9 [Pseudomonadaceae bacterium]|nr:50S ribosomal protein L9 [Pseudomonadaceae bacterium]